MIDFYNKNIQILFTYSTLSNKDKPKKISNNNSNNSEKNFIYIYIDYNSII